MDIMSMIHNQDHQRETDVQNTSLRIYTPSIKHAKVMSIVIGLMTCRYLRGTFVKVGSKLIVQREVLQLYQCSIN
jgi:hypothetical protein